MRISLVCAVGIALNPVWAFSADYEVPSDGALADAVQAANKNTGKTYEIDISESLSKFLLTF